MLYDILLHRRSRAALTIAAASAPPGRWGSPQALLGFGGPHVWPR